MAAWWAVVALCAVATRALSGPSIVYSTETLQDNDLVSWDTDNTVVPRFVSSPASEGKPALEAPVIMVSDMRFAGPRPHPVSQHAPPLLFSPPPPKDAPQPRPTPTNVKPVPPTKPVPTATQGKQSPLPVSSVAPPPRSTSTEKPLPKKEAQQPKPAAAPAKQQKKPTPAMRLTSVPLQVQAKAEVPWAPKGGAMSVNVTLVTPNVTKAPAAPTVGVDCTCSRTWGQWSNCANGTQWRVTSAIAGCHSCREERQCREKLYVVPIILPQDGAGGVLLPRMPRKQDANDVNPTAAPPKPNNAPQRNSLSNPTSSNAVAVASLEHIFSSKSGEESDIERDLAENDKDLDADKEATSIKFHSFKQKHVTAIEPLPKPAKVVAPDDEAVKNLRGAVKSLRRQLNHITGIVSAYKSKVNGA